LLVIHVIRRLVPVFIIVLIRVLEPLLLASRGVLHVHPDLIVDDLELLIDFLDLHSVDLDCQAGQRGIELLELQWLVPHYTRLLEYLLNFQLRKRYFEILAEFHEFSEVDLTHGLFELLEFAVLRDVLSRVEVEDLLKPSSPEL